MNIKKSDCLLYAITNRQSLKNNSLYDAVKKAISGGITILQYREKNLSPHEYLEEAIKIKELCNSHNIPFIINDNVDVAIKIDADGVHLGQDDMSLDEARKKLGPDKIIGVSAHSVNEALAAVNGGANYLGVGAMFQTSSKNNVCDTSIETLKAICNVVSVPVVAIGGINTENIPLLSGSGISGVAVINAIFGNDDIENATKKLKSIIQEI